jgi:hypothetical protein
MEPVRVLILNADDTYPPGNDQVDANHSTFCRLVNDTNTDTLMSDDATVAFKVAANGKTLNFAPNPRGTQLAERFIPGFAARDHLVGTVVVLGVNEDGDLCDVPDPVLSATDTLFGP